MVLIRLFEDVLIQLLVEQMVKHIHYVIDWLYAFPWQIYFG